MNGDHLKNRIFSEWFLYPFVQIYSCEVNNKIYIPVQPSKISRGDGELSTVTVVPANSSTFIAVKQREW